MHHQLTIPSADYNALKAKQRHLVTKASNYERLDELTLTEEGTRNQQQFTIMSITGEQINKRMVLLSLYAPYMAEDDVSGIL